MHFILGRAFNSSINKHNNNLIHTATKIHFPFPSSLFIVISPRSCQSFPFPTRTFSSSPDPSDRFSSIMPLSVPKPPLSYHGLVASSSEDSKFESIASFSLPSIVDKLLTKEDTRECVYKATKLVDRQMGKCRTILDRMGIADIDGVETYEFNALNLLLKDALSLSRKEEQISASLSVDKLNTNNALREANLGYKLEDTVRLYAFRYFLHTGKLITLKECNDVMSPLMEKEIVTRAAFNFRDEEYLGGVIGLAQDLAKYGIGRATVRDVVSVEIARDLVSQLLASLLNFDWRNTPLRRKFDGTKYTLKRLENTLYELSVTNTESSRDDVTAEEKLANDDGSEPAAKRGRLDGDSRIDDDELLEIKVRMEARDELREKVIKRTRDSQKAAKQAIYCLHRGDTLKADKLILECENIAKELLPIIEREPQLRTGSYSNSLEEYAEAQLFKVWLSEKRIATPEEMPLCNEQEFLGGLCDLTGEVGRVAVAKGTLRDTEGVQLALVTNMSVRNALEGLILPKNISKKLGALDQSISKLEQMLYELSLIIGSGRTSAPSGGMANDADNKDSSNDNDN